MDTRIRSLENVEEKEVPKLLNRKSSGSIRRTKIPSLPGFGGLVSHPSSPPPFLGSSPRSAFKSSSPTPSVSPRNPRGVRTSKKVSMDVIATSPRGLKGMGRRSFSKDTVVRSNLNKDLETVLNNLDLDGDQKVTTIELREALSSTGLHPQVIEAAVRQVDEDGDGNITFQEILKLKTHSASWILNALLNDLSIRDHKSFTATLDECYLAANHETDLEDTLMDECNEDLTNEEACAFAGAFCSVDGQFWEKGESKKRHTLQACSFPIMYCTAIEKVGAKRVHSIVGQEPRGQGTSEYQMDKFGKPHNPMIPLGAVATASLVEPHKDLADRFQEIVQITEKLVGKDERGGGGEVTFDNYRYLRTSEGAVREFSLAYGAKEKGAFPNVHSHDDLTNLLRFHFMCESMELSVSQLSILAATLARGGINPLTRERVFGSETAQNCLSVLYSCGLKDLTGSFAFEIGLPAKCGRSGMIMVAVPGVGGFALHSPLMRESDLISVKGINFFHQLIHRLPFHIFDPQSAKLDQVSVDYAEVYQLIYSAANGDLATVYRLVVHQEIDVNSRDYDKRTALHLAVTERRKCVIKFLLERGAEINSEDRWGSTPLSEAKGDSELTELLKSFAK